MRIDAWPFLVGRNKVLGYQTIVSPPFLSEAGLALLLAESVGGNTSAPGAANYEAITGTPLGDLCLIYRTIIANARDYDLESEGGILADKSGRPIRLFEGFVVQGTFATIGQFPVVHQDLQAVHNQVKDVFREFWYADEAFSERTSQPFQLQMGSSSAEGIILLEEPPFVVSHLFKTPGIHKTTISRQEFAPAAGFPAEQRIVARPLRKRIQIRTVILALISIALLFSGGVLVYKTFIEPPFLIQILKQVAPTCNNPRGTVWSTPLSGTLLSCTNSGVTIQQTDSSHFTEADLNKVNNAFYNQKDFRVKTQMMFPVSGDSSTSAGLIIQTPQNKGGGGGYIFTLNTSGKWALQQVLSDQKRKTEMQGTTSIDKTQAITLTIGVKQGMLDIWVGNIQVINQYNEASLASSDPSAVGLIVESSDGNSSPVIFSDFELDN